MRAPSKEIPVPSDDRIAGFTTTMYAIVKKVVAPPIASDAVEGLRFAHDRHTTINGSPRRSRDTENGTALM